MTNVQRIIYQAECGFLSMEQVKALIVADRLYQVLVRCGACRFICAVQDVEHIAACIDAGGDYVRDVSALSNDYRSAVEAHKAEQDRIGLLTKLAYMLPIEYTGAMGANGDCISDADPGL